MKICLRVLVQLTNNTGPVRSPKPIGRRERFALFSLGKDVNHRRVIALPANTVSKACGPENLNALTCHESPKSV